MLPCLPFLCVFRNSLSGMCQSSLGRPQSRSSHQSGALLPEAGPPFCPRPEPRRCFCKEFQRQQLRGCRLLFQHVTKPPMPTHTAPIHTHMPNPVPGPKLTLSPPPSTPYFFSPGLILYLESWPGLSANISLPKTPAISICSIPPSRTRENCTMNKKARNLPNGRGEN